MPEIEKPIWKDILSLLIIGFGIGWLAGISISPVASIVISALLGIAISIVGITSLYLKFPKDGGDPKKIIGIIEFAEEIKIRTFALLVVGIVAGVNIGILMRVHETLGVEKRDESFVNMQKDLNELRSWFRETEKANNNAKISLSEEQIAQRILDKYYHKGGDGLQPTDSGKINTINVPWLKSSNSSKTEICSRLSKEEDLEDLKEAIKMGDIGVLEEMSRYVDDDNLKRTAEIICELLTKEE